MEYFYNARFTTQTINKIVHIYMQDRTFADPVCLKN